VLWLEEALKVDAVSLASTRLNLCANLSKQGRHSEALVYAKEAISSLTRQRSGHQQESEYTSAIATASPNTSTASDLDIKENGFSVPESQRNKKDVTSKQLGAGINRKNRHFWATLQIAHYNAAVEQEHLGRFREAVHSFERARQIVLKYLRDGNPEMIQAID